MTSTVKSSGDPRIEDAVTRLLAELDIPELDLPRTRDDLIIEAYSRRGQQIAYSEKQPTGEESAAGVQR